MEKDIRELVSSNIERESKVEDLRLHIKGMKEARVISSDEDFEELLREIKGGKD